ncbi:MAG: hypothetical protein ACI4B5_01395 [Bacteroidaceae bacterium]
MRVEFLQRFRALTVAATALLCLPVMAEDALLTALHGTPGYTNESYDMLIDGSRSTKWCMGNFNGAYVVFKADHAFVPDSYTLITGLDTKTYSDRNWKTWEVYAANFESDEEATRDAESWTLIDKREQLTTAEFPAENNYPVGFECTENPTTAYKYFKIELREIVNLSNGTMQMSEFTFSDPAPSVPLTAISGRDNLWGDGAYVNLVDNDQLTKWGGDNTPIWVIVKAEEPIKPDFYRLLTAGDSHTNPDRNWVDWTISGANFDSDEEATLESGKWTVVDERSGVGTERIPAARYTEAVFGFNKPLQESYQYYLINITATGGKNKMQMAEFGLGYNQYEINSIRNSYYLRVANFDCNVTAQRTLTEQFPSALQAILTASDVESVIAAYSVCATLRTNIQASQNAYITFQESVSRLRNEYNEDHINAAGQALVSGYLDTNTAPNADYPNGSAPYIMENLLLSVEQIDEEIGFINNLIATYSSDLGDPIDVTYIGLSGTDGASGNESFASLFDGTETTKWCTKQAQNEVIFCTSSPIKPTFYKLITANDTDKNPNRNWKTWNIYAANFDNEEQATSDAEGWVLIDQKSNIGTDMLPGDSYKSAYFYLSNAPSQEYSYFKIEIKEIVGDNTMQMAEFSFGNQASFFAMREEYYEEYSYFDLETPAYRELINEYSDKMERLKSASTISQIGTLCNELTALQATITTSQEQYAKYQEKVAEVEFAISELEGPVVDFLKRYINDEVEPGEEFAYGSYPYIMINCHLTDAQISTQIGYLNNLLMSAVNGAYLAIEGTAGFNDSEGFAALVDGDSGTKWGVGDFTVANCIFKVSDTEAPFFYTLITGNDTEGNPGRNWKKWNVYGANFEKDSQAKVDAEGWVLVDKRENIGPDRIPAANFASAYFGLTEDKAPRYKYYKVEVLEPYDGVKIQMSEFTFGTQEDFTAIKEDLITQVMNFDLDVIAQQSLIDAYDEASTAIEEPTEMDALVETYVSLKAMQDTIARSAEAYSKYIAAATEMETFVTNRVDIECEQMDLLREYITDYVEPNEDFPNGSYPFIRDNHTITIDQLAEETAMMLQMQKDAVFYGYGAGAEITTMLTNPDFSDGWNGWDGTEGYATGRADNGLYAAEATKAFDLSQTLTGIKNGVYEFVMTAGYRPGNIVTSDNLAAVVYANDNENYIMSIREGMIPAEEAEDGVNCHLTGEYPDYEIKNDDDETIGYGLHGVHSVCYAIGAGRHENHVAVLVTDGTLTVGIRDTGTGYDWDWTGFGNARLFYLGTEEEAADALDRTLTDMANRAQTLLEYQSSSEEYQAYPNFGNEQRGTLISTSNDAETAETAEEKLNLIGTFTSTFRKIREDKAAYVRLLDVANKIQDKWSNQPLSDFNTLFDDLFEKGWEPFESGEYNAEEAKAAAESMLAKYPDYLEYNEEKASNGLLVEQTEPFTYTLTVTGANPFAAFSGLYFDLDEEHTILHFQYRASRNVTDGEIFFAAPDLDGSKNFLYGELTQTEEWKDAYYELKDLREAYGWGNADHWIRWDITNGTDLTFDVRNIVMITAKQAEAEGGTVVGIGNLEETSGIPAGAKGIYTLTGVRVEKAVAPGIYIMNGRKVLVR